MGKDIRRNRTQYCENELIDAICLIKAEECEEEHLPFLIEINLGKEDLIHYDSYHITGILMNLLDNALEAEKKVRRNLRLQTGKRGRKDQSICREGGLRPIEAVFWSEGAGCQRSVPAYENRCRKEISL